MTNLIKGLKIQLSQELENLEEHLNFCKFVVSNPEIISGNHQNFNLTHFKQVEYAAFVISLYGIIERTVENACHAYLKEIAHLTPLYDELPGKIKESNEVFSVDLIKKVHENKIQKYRGLSVKEIVKNLNNCLQNEKKFNLNINAFTLNAGNMNHLRIKEIFKGMSIDLETNLSSQLSLGANSNSFFNKLNKIIERRNDVAHGGNYEILDISYQQDMLEFSKKYLIAILDVLENVKKQTDAKINSKEYKLINENDLVQYSSKLFGLTNIDNSVIKVGDWVRVQPANCESFKILEIISIQNHPKGITFELEKSIRENYSIVQYRTF